jgi:plastocyanin
MDPTEESTRTRGRRALAPALAVLITAAVVVGAGVAGAKQSTTIYISESGGPCFTTQPGNPPCGARPEVTIQTGDAVTWDFAGGTGIGHNVADGDRPINEARWKSDFLTSGTYSHTYGVAGTYRFVCQAHAGMEGTVIVEGETVETPTSTPADTPAPSPTPTPTAAPSMPPDDHTRTPAPGRGAKDAVAPRARTMRLTGGRASVKVRFWLSEPATVVLDVTRRGSKRVLASATVQSPAGTRTVTLRSKRLKRGAYAVALRATDAMANKSTAASRTVRLRRSR